MIDYQDEKCFTHNVEGEPITYYNRKDQGDSDHHIAVALTFVFSALVNLSMGKRLRDVSMTESLKSID